MDSNERETETEGDLGDGCERASERGGGSGDVRGLERQEERNRQREREKGREREREKGPMQEEGCTLGTHQTKLNINHTRKGREGATAREPCPTVSKET